MRRNDIVGACLSQFHDDENSFELLLGYADGREIGHVLSKRAAQEIAAVFANEFPAALSIEQTQPVKVKVEELKWRELPIPPSGESLASSSVGLYCIPHGGDRFYLKFRDTAVLGDFSTLGKAKAAAQQDYKTRILSALVNAQADAAVVERWQPIDTAPRDGTPVDLWGVNHLHPRKTGRRATDVTWGRVRDWLGNERDDWQHGQGDDFEPTHWCPVPAAPLSSLRPAEVGSATKSKGSSDAQ